MIHVITKIERPSKEIIDRFRTIGSATVHEASGRKGAIDAAIKPIAKVVRICGPAFTVQCHPGDNLMLHKALERAATEHNQKYQAVTEAEPDWEKIKEKCRSIREANLTRLPELILRFRTEAEMAGAETHLASTPEQALSAIDDICRAHQAKLIVKSMVSEEIGLSHFLEGKGYRLVETDLGE
jgi:hypothetical protein